MNNKFEKNKMEYLDTISSNENSKKVYKRVFNNADTMEFDLDKDIFNFNEDELEQFIKKYLKPKTKESARTYCNILSSYIQWAIDHKNNENLTNPIRRRQDYFYNFVEDQNSLYLSKDQINMLTKELKNNQDSFLIQGLFEGIQGNQVSELTSLTLDQILSAIKNNNVLIVKDNKDNKDKKREREIDVSDKLLNLAILANKELTYEKSNGGFVSEGGLSDYTELIKSNYILKPSKTSSKLERQISHHTIYNRLNSLKKLEGMKEFKKALTTKNIARSGMIWEAKKVLDNGKEITKDIIMDICDKYGMNYKWSLGDFLNEDTVNQVYKNSTIYK